MRCWIAVFCIACSLAVTGVYAQTSDWLTAATDELVAASSGHRLVLLGEMHGTREIPLLVGAAVERMSRSEPVLLALEVHASEHDSLKLYLRSDGSPPQRELLRQRAFWSVGAERNDGRRSEDMLDLVEQVRNLRELGRDVAILPFDVANGSSRGSSWRDQAMAAQLRRAWVALPRGRMLVLTGNVHAMRKLPDYAPPQMQAPMGASLQDLQPLSIEIGAMAGAFWACPTSGTCGPVPIGASGLSGRMPDSAPFHYRIVLPVFTPARQVASAHPD